MLTIKTQIYDSFHCIADKCLMTCCQGWSVKVDAAACKKWQACAETAYIMENTQPIEDEQTPAEMKMDASGACLLLDSQGLCEIVKRHGGGYLCDTCALFPRKRNEITQEDGQVLIQEYSLSGACPAVIDMLEQLHGPLGLEVSKDSGEPVEFPMEYRIRNVLICMLQGEGIYRPFTLAQRIMLGFCLLQECLDCQTQENVDDCLAVYAEYENVREKADFWEGCRFSAEEVMEELCQTFWNVTEYYKELPMYRGYLWAAADRVDSWYPEYDSDKAGRLRLEAYTGWAKHKQAFSAYDGLAQAVMAAEVFSDCISDELVELTEHYQAIVLEYVMTRMSTFLLEADDAETVKRYFSLFIRIIGHNAEGMAEYWEENFEDSILEQEYLWLLLS